MKNASLSPMLFPTDPHPMFQFCQHTSTDCFWMYPLLFANQFIKNISIELLGYNHKLYYFWLHTLSHAAERSTVPVYLTGSGLFLCWPYLSLAVEVIEECLYLRLPLSVTVNTSGQVLALLCHSNTHTDSAVGHDATLNQCLGCLLRLPSFCCFTLLASWEPH